MQQKHIAMGLIKAGGLLVGVFGFYVLYLSGTGAWESVQRFAWPAILLEVIFPVVGLILGMSLIYLAYRLIRRPTLTSLGLMAVAMWFVIDGLLFTFVLRVISPWIKAGKVDTFESGAFNLSAVVAAILCMVGYGWLATRSGLMGSNERWWCPKNIRGLCGCVVFGMFMTMVEVIDVAKEWIAYQDEILFESIVFWSWILLMLLVYKLGPRVLMAITHVEEVKRECKSFVLK